MPELLRTLDGLAVYHRAPSEVDPDDPGGPTSAVPPRVVLVHGSMDRSASFLKATRRLRHLDITRYDRRGYGRSAGGPLADGLDGHVDDLVAVLGERPAAVVGHSFGALVALTAAARRPDLVVSVGGFEAPYPWDPDWPHGSDRGASRATDGARSPEDAAERFIRSLIGDELWEKLPPSVRQARRDEGPALLAEFHAVRDLDHPPFDVATLAPPVLIGYGSATAERHLRASGRLAAARPDAGPFVIDGAPHSAHSSHPDGFAGFIQAVADADRPTAVPAP